MYVYKNVYYIYLVFLNAILSKINVTVGGVGSDKTPLVYVFPQVPTLSDTVGILLGFTVGNHSATFKQ